MSGAADPWRGRAGERAAIEALRADELERFAAVLPPQGRLLEIGAGAGWQARALADRGFAVTAIDIPGSAYQGERVFDVSDYDGRHLPFADASFDAVYSSNVLEHVEDLPTLLAEMRRVLKPGGVAVHAMPSCAWRVWTSLAGPPKALVLAARLIGADAPPPLAVIKAAANLLVPHGIARTAFGDLLDFRQARWVGVLERHGFQIDSATPMGLFYTGNALLGRRLSFAARRRLADLLGSACILYVARPRPEGAHEERT